MDSYPLTVNKFGFKSCYEKFEKSGNRYIILSKIHLKGWIDYVNAIEPLLAKQYYSEFDEIIWDMIDKELLEEFKELKKLRKLKRKSHIGLGIKKPKQQTKNLTQKKEGEIPKQE